MAGDLYLRARERRGGAKRRPLLRVVLARVGAFAALAAALPLLVRLHDAAIPDRGDVGLGGSEARLVRLTAYVNAEGGARALEDGAAVPPAADLRFQVSAAGDCFLWILSVDAKGKISRLYPPQGTPPTRHSSGAVPGGAVLDGAAGPERLYAVCAPEPVEWSDVRRAAPRVEGADSVRRARAFGEPLAGVPQATLLLEKRP